ncbi:hypothetical protein C2E21_0239 [Chlorella sorokiniana]|uniref:Uncharacterized protein n=1 Tax=Chlorella sorokiniana TaxID=3076 RepID=A0A2P6U566_CHLSO|nr:hypothetical protein C2E21_0239 [Chlorella sorokiniana]|eukprot:PRW61459.1 hypothetical protein C2E21_0239 [Chlorella sorokiniana]
MVPADTDLVVLEFSINDDYYGGDRATYEQLLRKLLQLGRAVVTLHHYQYNVRRIQDTALGMPKGVFWWGPEQHYSLLAQYYDIPSVSIASAAWRLMAAGVEGFKVDKYDTANPSPTVPPNVVAPRNESASYFFSDPHHPGDQGHKVLAEALAAPLLRAVGEVQAQRLLPPSTLSALLLPTGAKSSRIAYRRTHARLLDLPPPMLPGNYEKRTLFCAMPADLKQVVKAASGFQYRAERPNATDFVRQKWGYSAFDPGDWLELEIDTRLDGHNASNTSQPVLVAFGCLHSYEHMGVAEATCTLW